MKSTIIKILGIVGTIVFLTLYLSNCQSWKNKYADVVTECDRLADDYDSCKNAKVYVDTGQIVTDHIIEYVDKPVPYEVLRIDTVIIDRVEYVYPVQKYSDTLRTDDFDLFWRAEGILDKIEFPYYRLYDETITESHVIEKVRTEYVYKPESALYFKASFTSNLQQGLNGCGGGLDYINKHGWGLGIQYQRLNIPNLSSKEKNFVTADVKLRIL